MNYKKGDRIKHPKLEEWGIGEVLEESGEEKVRAFFVGVGEKTLSLKHVQPLKVQGPEANHPLLDNLRISKVKGKIQYQSLAQSIQNFLERYPDGFYGERYLRSERSYKVRAHELALELLDQQTMHSLSAEYQYDQICQRSLKIVNATNLIFPNEKMALKDGLKQKENKKRFSEALSILLYGGGSLENRFLTFAETLEIIRAAKWTTASYFLFIIFPEKYVFIKPTATLNAANLSAFEIYYRPELNWKTYKFVLEFSNYLKAELSTLRPRDMIDVQSFMWCIQQ